MSLDPWPPQFEFFANPAAQWESMPSFMVGELLFVTCAIAALVHARRAGRANLLIWCAALIAGTANDLIFMALPLVDNFWQAQGTVMLTPRMPLYIPCVYVCFMYYPTVVARRLGLRRRTSTAALGGLLAVLFYAPYDIVGAKFVWWTWHDTDLPIATRLFGAPCSSTLWVLTFVGAFGWLVDWGLRGARGGKVSGRLFALGLLRVAGLTTLLMMVQITVLQQLDGGAPGYAALGVGALLYLVAIARGGGLDVGPRLPFAVAIAATYFVVLIAIALVFDPATHVSEGLHQPTGECYVEATDITGHTRHEFLCVTDFEEDFTFDCAAAPSGARRWYTLCGRAHRQPLAWKAVVVALGGVGALAFALVGLFRRRSERPAAR